MGKIIAPFFDLDQSNMRVASCCNIMVDVHRLPEKWLLVSIAPSDADLEVCVIDRHGAIHALVFPVRKVQDDWVDAVTKKRVDIVPTHWRKWSDGR